MFINSKAKLFRMRNVSKLFIIIIIIQARETILEIGSIKKEALKLFHHYYFIFKKNHQFLKNLS